MNNEVCYRCGLPRYEPTRKMTFKFMCMMCIALLVGAYGMKIYCDIQLLDCNDFATKHTIWKGFMAKDVHGDTRCFWLEQSYPNRVRQGVPVN